MTLFSLHGFFLHLLAPKIPGYGGNSYEIFFIKIKEDPLNFIDLQGFMNLHRTRCAWLPQLVGVKKNTCNLRLPKLNNYTWLHGCTWLHEPSWLWSFHMLWD